MKIMLDEGAVMPTRAHTYDAGLDLYAPYECRIPGSHSRRLGNTDSQSVMIGCAVIDTGVHVEIPEGYVGLIKSKSGLTRKNHVSPLFLASCSQRLLQRLIHPPQRIGRQAAQIQA